MQPGDVGVYITSSEWLDVNYGASLRRLLLSRLSLEGLHVFDPASLPFADAQVTGVITCFNFGVAPDTVLIDRVCTSAGLGSLMQGVNINRAVLESAPRWSSIGRSKKKYPQDIWNWESTFECIAGPSQEQIRSGWFKEVVLSYRIQCFIHQ